MSRRLSKLDVHPLTPDRWADLETIFEARGCSAARGCWCMYYRVSGKETGLTRPGDEQRVRSKAALKSLAGGDPPPGLLGYRDGTPVGWISLGPREDYARLARSPTMKAVDDQPAWAIVCFVVPSEYRKQGVARDLLAGAIRWARRRGGAACGCSRPIRWTSRTRRPATRRGSARRRCSTRPASRRSPDASRHGRSCG